MHWRRVSPAAAGLRSAFSLVWRADLRQPDGKSAALRSPPIVRGPARAWHEPRSTAVPKQTIGSMTQKLLSYESSSVPLVAGYSS